VTDHKNKSTLTTDVIDILTEHDNPSTVTIEYCAKALSFSMTSFRRKLANEHTSFKLIQQKYLNELCVKALLIKKTKIDELANTLGYSERATFERAFKNKYGTTPAHFRELSAGIAPTSARQHISDIINSLPTLSESTQKLLSAQKADNLDLINTTKIVASDPILSARIIGIASKAIYGKTPTTLKEAIGRNLGISTVVNLAVIHSLEESLNDKVDDKILQNILQASSTAPRLLKLFKQNSEFEDLLNKDLLEQVLMFGLLGLLILCHKNAQTHEIVRHCFNGYDDLNTLNQQLFKLVGQTLFSSSAMMLSLWHLDATVIKSLNTLHKITISNSKQSQTTERLLFMMSCIFHAIKKERDLFWLEEKAELLNFGGFKEIKQLLI